MQTTFNLQFDDGKFWQYDEGFDTQSPADFDAIQAMSAPFKWSIAVKGRGQRKYHARSTMTNSVWAMLDVVKMELRNDACAIVRVMTPDVEVLIGC